MSACVCSLVTHLLLSICLSPCVCLFLSLSVLLYVCMYAELSVCLFYVSTCLCVSLYISPSFSRSVFMPVYQISLRWCVLWLSFCLLSLSSHVLSLTVFVPAPVCVCQCISPCMVSMPMSQITEFNWTRQCSVATPLDVSSHYSLAGYWETFQQSA